jgi:plastocyanin
MRPAWIAILFFACGGGDPPGSVDALAGDDGPPSAVVEVTPCTGEAATVSAESAEAGSYSPPATTISQNQVVKFVMSGAHNVVPHPTQPSDPNLAVGFGETKCFRFTQPGTYTFFCQPHGFAGTVTVN